MMIIELQWCICFVGEIIIALLVTPPNLKPHRKFWATEIKILVSQLTYVLVSLSVHKYYHWILDPRKLYISYERTYQYCISFFEHRRAVCGLSGNEYIYLYVIHKNLCIFTFIYCTRVKSLSS